MFRRDGSLHVRGTEDVFRSWRQHEHRHVWPVDRDPRHERRGHSLDCVQSMVRTEFRRCRV